MQGVFEVSISASGPTILLRIEGDLDASRAPELLDLILLTSVVQEHRQVMLDMSKVTFVDSTGLAAIVEARNRLHQEGITLTVLDPSPCVVRLVSISGLEAFFGIEPDLPPAMPDREAS